MVDFDDQHVAMSLKGAQIFELELLDGWAVRRPTPQARRWAQLSGLAHGLVLAFPFVAIALLWRLASGADGDKLWPVLIFSIGMVLLLISLIKGIVVPRTWWFAYNDRELIVEHGLLFKARDHVALDRVQYLERRAGPIMRHLGLASLIFDTAAGHATVPAAQLDDIAAIELRVRAAMQHASVL